MGAAEELSILDLSLLETELAGEFRQLSNALRVPLGWHYLLDLAWAAGRVEGERVIDAGAGLGLMQWWLAARGVQVVSIDREPRRVARRLRAHADVEGVPSLRQQASRTLVGRSTLRSTAGAVRDLVLPAPRPVSRGRVTFIEADLRSLPLPDDDADCVVSISALEHNDPDQLPAAVEELMRALKPGGRLVATVAAGKTDWLHEPSRGWCYSEQTLRRVFDISAPSNYGRYDVLLDQLRRSSLKDELAAFYYASGDNGMPWGRWDPKYQPVGVVKIKP